MGGVCCDADGAEIGIPNGYTGGLRFGGGGLLGLVDAEDAHDGAARAGDDAIGKVAVSGDEDVTGEFADWHLVGSFLQFDDLLVDELGSLVDDEVGV